jgi:hypothetical protein
MLTLSEAFHWIQVGFCIGIGWAITRLFWFLFLYLCGDQVRNFLAYNRDLRIFWREVRNHEKGRK